MTPDQKDGSRDKPGRGRFQDTHWSWVLAAGEGSEAALAQLCQAYWYPLYAYLRGWGHSRDDAEDLTQGFFAQLIEKNYVQTADPARGRFRSFLLASLNRFLSRQKTHDQAKKRGGDRIKISWDAKDAEARYARENCDELTPELLFERGYALSVLERAGQRLKDDYRKAGKGGEFEALHPYLAGADGEPSYAETAQKLGMNQGAVRVAVCRMRGRFGEQVRSLVAETLEDPAETMDEVRHLFAVLSRSQGSH